jgi:hypothetical protein
MTESTAAGTPSQHEMWRVVLAKLDRVEGVMGDVLRGLEREVADREHDVGRERRRRRWSLVVVAVFAAAIVLLGAVQVRVIRDERAHDAERACVSGNASREVVRTSIDRVFVLIAQVSPPDRRAAVDAFRRQIEADLTAHLPARNC